MRSKQEREAAVKQRIAEMQAQQLKKRHRIALYASIASCLVLIVCLSAIVPSMVSGMVSDMSADYQTTASIFSNSTFLGYIVVGLISFILGICVTILCFRIRLMQRDIQTTHMEQEDADGRIR